MNSSSNNSYFKDIEYFIHIQFVNNSLKPISVKKYDSNISIKTDVPARKIVHEAINTNAYGIYLVHNHPSGIIKPSENDLFVTKLMYDTLLPLDISLIDHIIVGKDSYYSIGEHKDYKK